MVVSASTLMAFKEIAEETVKDNKEVLGDFLCLRQKKLCMIRQQDSDAMDHHILQNYICKK